MQVFSHCVHENNLTQSTTTFLQKFAYPTTTNLVMVGVLGHHHRVTGCQSEKEIHHPLLR